MPQPLRPAGTSRAFERNAEVGRNALVPGVSSERRG